MVSERTAKIYELSEQGCSQRKIAAALGISKTLVHKILAARGAPRVSSPSPSPSPSPPPKPPSQPAHAPLAHQESPPAPAPPPPQVETDATDDELLALARLELVARAKRIARLLRDVDRLAGEVPADKTTRVRDLVMAGAILQDKLVQAVEAAKCMGPVAGPRQLRAVFGAEVVDTPPPEGAPDGPEEDLPN